MNSNKGSDTPQGARLRQSDEVFLKECLDMAWRVQTLALPNPSVGALITDSRGEIIGRGVHRIAGSAHAEILAIKEAALVLFENLGQSRGHTHSSHGVWSQALEDFRHCQSSEEIHAFLRAHHAHLFKDCTLYVSLEPCNHHGRTPSCAALIEELGFARVVIGALDPNPIAQGGAQRLREAGITIDFLTPPAGIDKGGKSESSADLDSEVKLLARRFEELLLPFEILRTKGRFVLFKLAQRLDGSYQNGRISCVDSEIFTHNQRAVCDHIIISGKTLLCDSPQLNARFATPPFSALVSQNPRQSPLVGILSRRDSSEINALIAGNPHLQQRATHLKSPREIEGLKGFVIIEGGVPLLEACLDSGQVDMLLIHQATHYRAAPTHSPHHLSVKLSLLHAAPLGEDLALWLR